MLNSEMSGVILALICDHLQYAWPSIKCLTLLRFWQVYSLSPDAWRCLNTVKQVNGFSRIRQGFTVRPHKQCFPLVVQLVRC